MTRLQVGSSCVELVKGDITKIPVDAIVNAANRQLAGGGGVDGVIHRAGGPSLMHELDIIRAQTGGCDTGSAVVTSAGELPARFVFHAVGPVYRGGNNGEAALLASCYTTALQLAADRNLRSISFPSISTGVYGYPVAQAADVALSAIVRWLRAHPDVHLEVKLAQYSDADHKIYQLAAERCSGLE